MTKAHIRQMVRILRQDDPTLCDCGRPDDETHPPFPPVGPFPSWRVDNDRGKHVTVPRYGSAWSTHGRGIL